MITVGLSQNYDTKVAFYDAVNQCNLKDAALLIVFAGARHSPDSILSASRSNLPNVSIFGGSVVGTITRDSASYSGYEMSVIIFTEGPDLPLMVGSDPNEFTDEMIGYSLGQAVAERSKSPHTMIMFYTSVANSKSRQLHHATIILNAFSGVVNSTDLQIAGGGLLTGFNFEDSWAIGHNKIYKHYAFAMLFPDHIKLDLKVLRACQPAGPTMTITGIDGSRVTSIDNKPALEVICLLLDRKPDPGGNIIGLNLCLGLIKSSRTSKTNSDNDINRVIVSENIADGSICLLEPDFYVGDQVQLMLRDNDYMMSDASIKDVNGSMFSMYIDCAGRASILTGSIQEEGIVAMSSLSRDTPSIGLYSGVEIASLGGIPTALDLTGVMVSLVKS